MDDAEDLRAIAQRARAEAMRAEDLVRHLRQALGAAMRAEADAKAAAREAERNT